MKLKDVNKFFCLNCCNLMDKNLEYVGQIYPMGAVFDLNQRQRWIRNTKMIFTRGYIEECRAQCNQQFPVKDEEPEFEPPKDVTLGMTKSNPGFDCVDIKENGPGTSGLFYVQPVAYNDAFQVYCDNETDNGGWTLYLSYHYEQGQIMELNKEVPL